MDVKVIWLLCFGFFGKQGAVLVLINIMPDDPCGIIYHICQMANDWSELQKPKVERAFRRGTSLMKMVMQDVFNKTKGWAPLCQKIDSG